MLYYIGYFIYVVFSYLIVIAAIFFMFTGIKYFLYGGR